MKIPSFNCLFFIYTLLLIHSVYGRRSRTTTTTTEASDSGLTIETLADREASLNEREEAFRRREALFRLREEKLTVREDLLNEREGKIETREKNIAGREQNTLKGRCKASTEDSTMPLADFTQFRYDIDEIGTPTLREIGDIAQCSENMRFFAVPENETSGQCDCDYHKGCGRPLLYNDKYKQCFWAWSQGPCEQHEWYTYNMTTLLPICEPNPCPESPGVGVSSYYFRSPEDDKCYKAGSRGPCKGEGERLYIIPTDPIPKCRKQAICPAQSVPAVQRCIPGNRRDSLGLCDQEGDFE